MFYRKLIFPLAIIIMLGLQPLEMVAAPPLDEGGQVYVVQADDWLSKLADKFYGDPLAYLVIVEATNNKAAQDTSFAAINDPDFIEVGQKLFVPAVSEISAEVVAAAKEEKVMLDGVTAVESQEPTPEQLQLLASLGNRGTPPELYNEVWLNSEPLKLANLKGKVVLVEFWTFG